MLIKLENITTPVVLVMDGKESEYVNGSAAVAALGSYHRLEAVDITVRENKIVIQLAEWKSNSPMNYIGEEAVIVIDE